MSQSWLSTMRTKGSVFEIGRYLAVRIKSQLTDMFVEHGKATLQHPQTMTNTKLFDTLVRNLIGKADICSNYGDGTLLLFSTVEVTSSCLCWNYIPHL